MTLFGGADKKENDRRIKWTGSPGSVRFAKGNQIPPGRLDSRYRSDTL